MDDLRGADRAEFRILGPLAVVVDGSEISLGGTRQRTVLAVLLLHEGQVLPIDHLVDVVWGDRPPSTARNQVKTAISALRDIFRTAGVGPVIETQSRGYVIAGLGARFDLHQFDALVRAGRTARDTGDPAQALAHVREALRLWRGSPLVGLGGRAVEALSAALAQRRLNAVEEYLALRLVLGEYRDVADDAAAVVAEYPNRERFWALYMYACYRDNNRAGALEVFRSARRHLIDELGLEPGEELQRLHRAVLAGTDADRVPAPVRGPTIKTTPSAPAPCVLPPAIADFIGRASELKRIIGALGRPTNNGALATPVVAIAGRAGVGKSALAVHAAHQLRDAYPDGQLFLDLHGTHDDEVGPAEALARLLRMLGVPDADMPARLDELAELYRARLVNRRVLVVLDNVADERQALPLLPGVPTCGVLLTARARPSGLAGITLLELEVLSATESARLLATICGDARVQSDLVNAQRVAELCGRLPLAVRVAGSKLAARPHWTTAYLADRLSDEDARLDELRWAHLDTRAALEHGYRALPPEQRRLFRLLGSLDAPHSSAWVAAALLNSKPSVADPLLERLVDVALLDVVAADGPRHPIRYTLHDLVRIFARERARAEETRQCLRDALGRVFEGWLALTEHAAQAASDVQAHGVATGGWCPPIDALDAVAADPQGWLRSEGQVLRRVIQQAADLGLGHVGTRIAEAAGAVAHPR